MPTDNEIEAAAKICRPFLLQAGFSPYAITESLAVLIPAALTAAEQVRAHEVKVNCKHPNKQGQGAIGSDGSTSWSWYCPSCGASDEGKITARITND